MATPLTAQEWKVLADRHLSAAQILANSTPAHSEIARYLAGFALELLLKRKIVNEGLSTQKVHGLGELLIRSQIRRLAAVTAIPVGKPQAAFPNYLDLFFAFSARWHNEMRYDTSTWTTQDAIDMIEDAQELMNWIWTA